MYEQDYILRIIQQMGVMLRAMIAGIREQRPDDVRATSREALTLLLGVPPELTDSLTPEGLITLMSVGGVFEAKRGLLAAEVFVRRAQADAMSGLTESAAADAARALRLLAEVEVRGDDADAESARALLAELGRRGGTGEAS